MNPNQLLEKLNWRYAVKKFDASKKLSSDQWSTLEKALTLTPSSYGLQPWKFLVVQDPTIRKKLREASWNQSQVEDCSQFVVFTTKLKMDEDHVQKYMERIAQVRNIPVSSVDGFKNAIIGDVIKGPRSAWAKEWLARQAYIALGNLMTSAAMIGVDTCPMEGLDPAKYNEILGLNSSGYHTIMACAVGFRSGDDQLAKTAKVRFETKDVVKII